MSVFLYIPDIKGGATEENHKEWVRVDSIQFGVGRSVSTPHGAATSREASTPNVSEIHVTKPMDNSSIELFGWSVSKYDAKNLKIDIVTTGRKDPFTQFLLENAVISGYSVSASGDGMPMESISFNFTKLEQKFLPVGADMKSGNAVRKGFDIATGKAT